MPSTRILIVDDDAAARRCLATVLSGEGFVVLAAPDGRTCLERAGRDRPDLVITDLMMPGMSGVELCRELHRRDPDLPVVLATGHSDVRSAVDGLRAGVEDYLLKPLDLDAVLGCIERVMDRRALKAERELLRQQNEELYRNTLATVQAYEESLAIVSHDLRNPLGILRIEAERLLRLERPEAVCGEVPEIAEGIRRATKRMAAPTTPIPSSKGQIPRAHPRTHPRRAP
jgi:DNA-binding NtrC family response regulator